MKFNYIHSDTISALESDYLVVGLTKENSLTEITQLLSAEFANTAKEIIEAGDFKGNFKEQLSLLQPTGLKAKRILLLGLGDTALSNKQWFTLMQSISSTLLKSPALNCHIVLPEFASEACMTQIASDTASQIHQSCYVYTHTLNDSLPKTDNTLSSITLVSTDTNSQNAVETGLQQGNALGQGLSLCRELGNLPANFCTPSDLQKSAEALAKDCDKLHVETLEEADMQALGMGSLLSVAAGSVEPAKLIVMHYNGSNTDDAPITLVGKGVTFDTGGISLKPGAKMDEMKYDMCGAASVLGTFKALTTLQPNINVIGLIPATENMPAGNATKPGDVVTSMSGKTIEILNTDAEGRLILCDALTYAEKFKPKAVIDIATLTGACIVALGHHRSALYSNNDELRQDLFNAGETTQDLSWPMPLDDMYTKQLKRPYADLGNIGGPAAGSVTAACFLAEFAKNYHWAHLDIAGAAWNSPGIKGASGRPVSLLFNYLLSKV